MNDANEKYLAIWTKIRDCERTLGQLRAAAAKEWQRRVSVTKDREKLRAEILTTYRITQWENELLTAKSGEIELWELAKHVALTPTAEMQKLRVSCVESYRMQVAAEKYAEGALVPDQRELIARGVPAEIRRDDDLDCFELWVALTPWQFDAFTRNFTIDTVKKYWLAFGVNPKVYGVPHVY